MKKYLPYLVIILALLAATVWFAANKSTSTLSEREGRFAVKDKNEIAKIILTDTENKSVELKQQNGVWMVNGKYPARPELVAQLFDALTRVTSLCPVPTAAHDNVIREMTAHHVQAQIFDAKNNLLKSYWVGGPSVDGKYTYMLLRIDGKPAQRPHMTYLPGVKGYLTYHYGTDEENWRSRLLFNYQPGDIYALQVDYTGEEKNSFRINRIAADSFSLAPVQHNFVRSDTYQQKYIRQYLGFYSSVFIEAYDNRYPLKDSMLSTTPYAIISVTGKNKVVNRVNLYRMPVSQRSKTLFDDKGNEITYDVDHFHAGIHHNQDFAIAQYYVFGKLLRSYKDFFFKPAQ